jgi:hypothetical protein
VFRQVEVGFFAITPSGNPEFVRFKLINTVHDIPARSKYHHIKQHGARYACHLCTISGKTRSSIDPKTGRPNTAPKTMVYPTHSLKYRTRKTQCLGYTQTPIVYARLGKYPHEVAPIDVMHNLYEGYFPYLLKLWKDDKRVNLEAIDREWCKQRLPYFVHRNCRSIISNLGYLSSFEIYMLFHYFHSLFIDHMPSDIYAQVKNVIEVASRLSQPLYRSETFILDETLIACVEEHERLYNSDSCTLNVHLLTHLIQCTRNHGPLPLYSAFLFEATIKSFVSHFHTVNSTPHALTMFDGRQLLKQKLKPTHNSTWVNNFEYLLQNKDSRIYDTSTDQVGEIVEEQENTVDINFNDNIEKRSKQDPNLVPCIILSKRGQTYNYPVIYFTFCYI